MKTMQYKGYDASIEYDDSVERFHGRVLAIRDVVAFEGTSIDELKAVFHASVDDYLAFCEEDGVRPCEPSSAEVVVRMSSDLQRQISEAADRENVSEGSFIASTLARVLETGQQMETDSQS